MTLGYISCVCQSRSQVVGDYFEMRLCCKTRSIEFNDKCRGRMQLMSSSPQSVLLPEYTHSSLPAWTAFELDSELFYTAIISFALLNSTMK